MPFDRVVGHTRAIAALRRALGAGRLPSTLLFSGPDGVGKRTVALALAQALVCVDRGAGEHVHDGCGACAACRRVPLGHHPDVVLVEPSRETRVASIKVAQARDLMKDIAARPFEASARCVIVEEADAFTDEAANALLKSLEEPPPTSHVVLVTSAPRTLLPTIRSRCQELRFGGLSLALVERFLVDEAGQDLTEARLRARLSGGSLGAALALDLQAHRELRQGLLAQLGALPGASEADRLDQAEALAAPGDDLRVRLDVLRSLLRDVAVLQTGGGADALVHVDVAADLSALAASGLPARALAERIAECRDALAGRVTGTDTWTGGANRGLAVDVLMDAWAAELAPARAGRVAGG